jgi:hypothetical protein
VKGQPVSKSPIHAGAVDWTGENPGIYLKEREDGPWSGLMCFFRVVYSPQGMGHGIVVLDEFVSPMRVAAAALIVSGLVMMKLSTSA